jgi:hypothetical protein
LTAAAPVNPIENMSIRREGQMPISDGFQRLFGAIASALILTLVPGFAQAQEKRPNVVV